MNSRLSKPASAQGFSWRTCSSLSALYDVCCLNGALIKGYQHRPQALNGNHLLGVLISVDTPHPVTDVNAFAGVCVEDDPIIINKPLEICFQVNKLYVSIAARLNNNQRAGCGK